MSATGFPASFASNRRNCGSHPFTRRVFILSLLATLHACSGFDAESMFISHAISVNRGEVHGLRGGKVSCLHCPMYFMFDAEPSLTARIVSKHQLQQVDRISQEIRDIEELVQREASWWQFGDPQAQDEVYWVLHRPTHPALEMAFRLLVIKNNKAFFITSGHFNREQYQTIGT